LASLYGIISQDTPKKDRARMRMVPVFFIVNFSLW
jgi:hypothetical protein